MRYEVIIYFDVWGNSEEGWDVNNQFVMDEPLVIPDYATDKEIISVLHNRRLLTLFDLPFAKVEEPGDFIEIVGRGGKPMIGLRPYYL